MGMVKNKRGISLHIRELLSDRQAPSIIFCCTPVLSVDDLEPCYLPLYERGFNVFAIDFAGMGNSLGDASDFTAEGVVDDFESLVSHIKCQATGNIYLFADAGIGGMIGQYYVCGATEIKGFAQFAAGIHRDISALGIPTTAAIICLPFVRMLCKIAPRLRLTMKPPKYQGYNATQDNEFYACRLQENKDFFRVSIHFARVLLEILVGRNSRIRQTPTTPTLVFKTTHDRYFPPDYFDRYFAALECRKKLCVIEDVHNSYILCPEVFATEVASWFFELEGDAQAKIPLHET